MAVQSTKRSCDEGVTPPSKENRLEKSSKDLYQPNYFHPLLIRMGQKMGHQFPVYGACKGLVTMGAAAILAHDIESFNARFTKLAPYEIKARPMENVSIVTQEECDAVMKKVEDCADEALLHFQEDRDFKAFLDGVDLAQSSQVEKPTFGIKADNLESLFDVICSKKLEDLGGIEVPLLLSGKYSLAQANSMFCYLKQLFDQNHASGSLIFRVDGHVTGLGYDSKSQQFILDDSNSLPLHHLENSEQAAKMIFASLRTEFSSAINCVIEVLTAKKALQNGLAEFLIKLEKERVDINAFALECEQQALNLAVSGKNRSAVELLLKYTPDVHLENRFQHSSAFMEAARAGNEEIMQLFIDAKARVNHKDSQDQSALYNASREGHAKVVELLLRHGAEDPEHKALRLAVDNTHVDVVKAHFDAGAPIMEDCFHLAIKRGCIELVKLYVDKGIALKPYHLLWAISAHNPEVIKFLIEKGLNVNTTDCGGVTAFEES